MKRKICVVITARPSYSRIKTVLSAIKADPELELQLVVGASALLERYGSVVDVIKRDGFEPNEVVYMVVEGENLVTTAKSTGMGVVELATIFDNLKPDIVVSIGDRYETIATAIAASYLNIPVAHIQGGEKSGSIDEKVRHAVTKLSNIHLVSTEKAAERVIKMGEKEDAVHITGCPSIDIAADILKNPKLDFDPFEKYGGVGNKIDLSEGYVVVMQHPVTTEYEEAQNQVTTTLHAITEVSNAVLWFWPNVDAGSDGTSKGIRTFRETERQKAKYLHVFKNMDPDDFLKLIINSQCLVGNSSVGIRECAYLGVPVVNIGNRQDSRERGENVIDVNYEKVEIVDAVLKQIKHGRYDSTSLYGSGDAGKKIADILRKSPLDIRKTLSY